MTENHGITEATDTGAVESGQTNESQVEDQRMFTQEEVDKLIGKRVAQVNQKYQGIDMEEYKALKGLKEQVEEEQLIKKQDFDGLLKKQKEKSTAEINSLRSELENIKVDGALINAASKASAVNPDHVAQLLRGSIKMDVDGSVKVVDGEGNARYTDSADPMSLDQLVEEFLSSHQYFRAAGPSGTGSTGNTEQVSKQEFDLSQLDMNNPKHREQYKKLKAEGKI